MNEIERLRSFFVDGDPTEEEIAAAWSRLQDAISSTDDLRLSPLPTLGGKRRRRRRVMFTSAVVVLLGSVLTVQLFMHEPAVASDMSKVAEATRIFPDEEFGGATVERVFRFSGLSGSFVGNGDDGHIVRHLVTFERTDRWDEDGNLQIRTVHAAPAFFDEATEREFGDEIRQQLRPGEVIIETHSPAGRTDYSNLLLNDPADLEDAIRSYLDTYGNPEIPYPFEVVDLIAGIHVGALPTPIQRAAMLEVLAGLEGLTEVPFEGGAAVSVTHDAHGPLTRFVFAFDSAGWLTMIESTYVNGIPEEGVPPGTVNVTWYDPPRVASDH